MQEALAIAAIIRRQNVQFMTTLTVVNAIIQIGNGIISANSGGGAPSGGADNLQKSLSALRDLLVPEDVLEKEKKAKRVKELLEKEVSKGSFKVRPMVSSKKTRGRIIRQRNGSNEPKS